MKKKIIFIELVMTIIIIASDSNYIEKKRVKVEGFVWEITNEKNTEKKWKCFEMIDEEDDEIEPLKNRKNIRSPGHELFKPNKIMQHKCDRHRLNRN